MQLKRGSAPLTVEREIDIEITREEVIGILSQFVKRKLGTDKLRFDDLSVVASKDDASGEMRLTGITLLGVEILPLQYPDNHAPVRVGTPAAPAPKVTLIPNSQQLPPPLQELAAAASAQAAERQ